MNNDRVKISGKKIEIDTTGLANEEQVMRLMGHVPIYNIVGNKSTMEYANAASILDMHNRTYERTIERLDILMDKYKNNHEVLADIFATFGGEHDYMFEQFDALGYDFVKTEEELFVTNKFRDLLKQFPVENMDNFEVGENKITLEVDNDYELFNIHISGNSVEEINQMVQEVISETLENRTFGEYSLNEIGESSGYISTSVEFDEQSMDIDR